MSDFNRWSNSSLSLLQTCGHKFWLKYIKKDYRPAGPNAVRGRAVHHVAKEAHKKQMMENGTWTGANSLMTEDPGSGPSLAEARDIAADSFEKEWQGGVRLKKAEQEEGEAKVKARSKDGAVDMAALYVGDVAPPIVPAAVERKIVVKPKDMDITLTGFIDLVQTDEGEVIRDLKTSDKAPNKNQASESQQLTMYHYIRLQDVKKMPRGGRLVHIVRTPKGNKMSIVEQDTTRDMNDIRRLVGRINTAIEAVKKGVFVPADQGAPGSPCSWCEYSDGTCEYVRRRS